MKRSREEETQQSHKKHKQRDESRTEHSSKDQYRSSHAHRSSKHDGRDNGAKQSYQTEVDHRSPPSDRRPPKPQQTQDRSLDQLPPSTSTSAHVPAYTAFTVPKGLPTLPSIKPGPLTSAPFKHKSVANYDRNSSTGDITYEKLEFVGDAYIELIASRLLFERFTHLTAGQQSQLRELLVKNETLAEYSRAYGFDERIEASNRQNMIEDAKNKGNKGFIKVMGDVFEAYVAAVIMSDVEDGFAVAEKWLTALWAPKLVEAVKNDRSYGLTTSQSLLHDEQAADPLKTYNPTAKADLQKRIVGGVPGTKLEYEKNKDPVELKGDQLGQNRHFIALYLTGYGHERKLLGKGEGKNKVEAGNWAATEAMHGDAKGIVDQCDAELQAWRAEREIEKAAKQKAKAQNT